MNYKELYVKQKKYKNSEDILNKLNAYNQYEQKPQIKKNLFDFNEGELRDSIKNIANKLTSSSIEIYVSIIRQYIEWADKEQYRTNKITDYKECLKKIQSELDIEARRTELESMLSREEVYKLGKEWNNKQESAIIALLFEGICGREFSEIRTLQACNINHKDNEIILKSRKITVPTELIEMLKVADKETVLYKDKGKKKFSYISSNYLFKIAYVGYTVGTNIINDIIDIQTIPRRLNYIGDNINFKLKSNNIKKSGICYYMSLFELKERKEPSLHTIAKILYRFDIKASIRNCYDFKKLYALYKRANKYKVLNMDEESIKIYNEINNYKIDTKFLYDKIDDKDMDNTSEFFMNCKADEELGIHGEQFIEGYLTTNKCFDFEIQYLENVTSTNCGYDFKVLTSNFLEKYLEIKATKNNTSNLVLYITRKEMEIAYKKGEDYYLCIVCFVDRTPKNLYIIKNPIIHLGLEKIIDSLINTKKNSLETCEIWPVQYMIKLDKIIIEKSKRIRI